MAATRPPNGKTTPVGKSIVWNLGRRIKGNLFPVLASMPFSAGGLYWMWESKNLLCPGIYLLLFAGIVAAVSLNWLGSPDNAQMRNEFVALYGAKLAGKSSDRTFVGFAQPNYSSLLDPHQDVGFLVVEADSLEFIGEIFKIKVPKRAIKKVTSRPNPHSMLGLGGWIAVEGIDNGQEFRLLIEPREGRTLRQSRVAAKKLLSALESWRGVGESA